MPRANRYFLPGHLWHITHRCHRCQFLLKFVRDRNRYLFWLFQARRRYGLCVLNYTVTSNHVHLLVKDTGGDVISRSMQLVASRTAQEFNLRKARKGAFWEDRYHATAVESGDHLIQCMLYIDCNMVRAGAVSHPGDWPSCGYREIMLGKRRNRIIHRTGLMRLIDIETEAELRETWNDWIALALQSDQNQRQEMWTGAVAVGSNRFVDEIRERLGVKARSRRIYSDGGISLLKEDSPAYGRISRP